MRERERVQIEFSGQGRTHQEHKDDCDINRIVKTFTRTGQVTHVNRSQPFFGDFTGPVELGEAIAAVGEARTAFQALPARVRHVSGNSPVHFLELMSDPEGRTILEEAGLKITEDPTLEEQISETLTALRENIKSPGDEEGAAPSSPKESSPGDGAPEGQTS